MKPKTLRYYPNNTFLHGKESDLHNLVGPFELRSIESPLDDQLFILIRSNPNYITYNNSIAPRYAELDVAVCHKIPFNFGAYNWYLN